MLTPTQFHLAHVVTTELAVHPYLRLFICGLNHEQRKSRNQIGHHFGPFAHFHFHGLFETLIAVLDYGHVVESRLNADAA